MIIHDLDDLDRPSDGSPGDKNGESHVVFLRAQNSPVINWEYDGIHTRVAMNRKWLQWLQAMWREKKPQTVIVVDTVSARLLEKSMLIMQQDKNHLQNGNTVLIDTLVSLWFDHCWTSEIPQVLHSQPENLQHGES